jgi:hypothetical protein
MRTRLFGALVACMLAAVLATGATGSSKRPIVIPFEKDCPVMTCWETPGSPVKVSTELAEVENGLENGLFHYTATETLSSSRGTVELSLVGVLDLNVTPNETVVKGYVIRGTWDGRNLAGSSVSVKARRVSGSIFAGRVTIDR